MGLIKIVLFQILFLAAVNLLLAEDSNSTAAAEGPNPPAGGSGDSNPPPGNHGGPDGPTGDHPPGPNHPEHEDENRFFFSLFPLLTSCNYTLQAGRTCASCTQALTCLPSGIGLARNCRGFFRYCNNGYCSLTQSATCANSTSSG